MTRAIKYLHDIDILHCDLHKRNWIVEEGTNKMILIDFSCAKSLKNISVVEKGERPNFFPPGCAPEKSNC